MEKILDFSGVCVLAICALTDIKTRSIPVILPLAFGVFSVCAGYDGHTLSKAVLGCIPGLLLILLHWPSKKQIGLGDGMMLMGMGFYLGIDRGVPVLMLSLGFLFLFSCVGLMTKKLNRKTCLPFAPFYLAAYMGVIVL